MSAEPDAELISIGGQHYSDDLVLCAQLAPWATELQIKAAVTAARGQGRGFVRRDGSEIHAYPHKQKHSAHCLDRAGFTRVEGNRDGLCYVLKQPPPAPTLDEQRQYKIVLHFDGVQSSATCPDHHGDKWLRARGWAANLVVRECVDYAVVQELDGNGKLLRTATVRVSIEE